MHMYTYLQHVLFSKIVRGDNQTVKIDGLYIHSLFYIKPILLWLLSLNFSGHSVRNKAEKT